MEYVINPYSGLYPTNSETGLVKIIDSNDSVVITVKKSLAREIPLLRDIVTKKSMVDCFKIDRPKNDYIMIYIKNIIAALMSYNKTVRLSRNATTESVETFAAILKYIGFSESGKDLVSKFKEYKKK